MSILIRRNVPLPEVARGHNNEVAAALRSVAVAAQGEDGVLRGDSIFIPTPADKDAEDFRKSIMNGVKGIFRKSKEEIGFVVRDVTEDGIPGVGVWRTEFKPSAPRKEKTAQQKAADKKKREERKKAKEAEAAKADQQASA